MGPEYLEHVRNQVAERSYPLKECDRWLGGDHRVHCWQPGSGYCHLSGISIMIDLDRLR